MQDGSLAINLARSGKELVLHAPMPGAEPEDITITLDSGKLTIFSRVRGDLSPDKVRLLQEWKIGDYYRAIELPFEVDSARVNATYDNGVLTISMPQGETAGPREIRLDKVEAAHGQWIGHRGVAATPASD